MQHHTSYELKQRLIGSVKLTECIKRADELLQLGNVVLATRTVDSDGLFERVDISRFNEFYSAALSFTSRTFGSDSTYHTQLSGFEKNSSYLFQTQRTIGLLRACRNELAAAGCSRPRV